VFGYSGGGRNQFLIPPPSQYTMDDARTFVYLLAIARKAFKEIKVTVDAAFGEKAI